MANATWRKLIGQELTEEHEDWSDVVDMTLTERELDRLFDCGFGGSEGVPFTVWTEARVYFPSVYDGAEGVASAPRHPCREATGHVGGE